MAYNLVDLVVCLRYSIFRDDHHKSLQLSAIDRPLNFIVDFLHYYITYLEALLIVILNLYLPVFTADTSLHLILYYNFLRIIYPKFGWFSILQLKKPNPNFLYDYYPVLAASVLFMDLIGFCLRINSQAC